MASWNPEKKHSDRERWICIYPAFINNKKTIAEGRRISKDKCVENPTYQEMRDVLADAGLTVGVENKMYPRDPNRDMAYRGRIRVHLKKDDGLPVNSKFATREDVMIYLGEMIPKLKSRQQKQGASEQTQQTSTKKSGRKKGKR